MITDREKALLRPGERIDDLQRSQLRIIQNPRLFSFGMDAVLLAWYAKAEPGASVLDLGTGTAVVPLLMSARTGAAHFTGLELEARSADMARRSVLLNGLQDRIEIVTGDIREADAMFAPASFDVIVSNPPYIPAGHGNVGPGDERSMARHEIRCTFADVAGAAAGLVRPGGHFYLVHRPFRLPEIITALRERQLEPKRMRLVYPYIDREPDMVLLDCVRGGRPRLQVEKPLIIWKGKDCYTEEVRELYGF